MRSRGLRQIFIMKFSEICDYYFFNLTGTQSSPLFLGRSKPYNMKISTKKIGRMVIRRPMNLGLNTLKVLLLQKKQQKPKEPEI